MVFLLYARRLGKILFLISTYCWVWIFILTVIFGGKSSISAIITAHPQISEIFDSKFYWYMTGLFYFNILMVIYYIFKSLSFGKNRTTRSYIKETDIDMFICFNEKLEGRVKILKEKYSNTNNYYVVVDKENSGGFYNSIRTSPKYYNVVLQTENLDEAIYLFDNLQTNS